MASSRIYVEESIAPKFIEEFKKAFGTNYKHGDPLDPSTTLGPQADERQGKIVMSYLEIGKRDGELIMGGNRVGEKGYFIEPTIFANVPDESRINKEEVFGPVAIIHTFKTEEEALRRANDTDCSSLIPCPSSPSPLVLSGDDDDTDDVRRWSLRLGIHEKYRPRPSICQRTGCWSRRRQLYLAKWWK